MPWESEKKLHHLPLKESGLIPSAICEAWRQGSTACRGMSPQAVSSDTAPGYMRAPGLGLEITAQIQVVRSVQPLALDSIHAVLMPVLKQDSHAWVPKSWDNLG